MLAFAGFWLFFCLCGGAGARLARRTRTEWATAAADWARQPMVAPVLAELYRSVAAEHGRTTATTNEDDDSALGVLRRLIERSPEAMVLVYEGRVIVDELFLKKEKHRKHALFIAALIEKGFHVPNAAYAYSGNSTGLCSAAPEDAVPCLVIAKRSGPAQRGVLVPNPYFHDVDFWDAVRTSIRKAASLRPFDERLGRAFWRGHIANAFTLRPPEDPFAEKCDDEVGNYARLAAATASRAYPDVVDVKCWHLAKCLDIRDDRTLQCEGLAYTPEMRRSRDDPATITQEGHVPKENFTHYQFVVNLPGSTQGSYSRNLNHLWFLGSVVLLWQSRHVEWYYPALQDGVTHRQVNGTTIVATVSELRSDRARARALLRGARDVDAALVCPECLAFYYLAVVRTLRFFFGATSAAARSSAAQDHHHIVESSSSSSLFATADDRPTDLDDACALRGIFAHGLDCADLSLVQVLPSKRQLSKFDLADAPRDAAAAKKKKLLHQQHAHAREASSSAHRRLSTAAQIAKLPPNTCEALANFAAEACDAQRRHSGSTKHEAER